MGHTSAVSCPLKSPHNKVESHNTCPRDLPSYEPLQTFWAVMLWPWLVGRLDSTNHSQLPKLRTGDHMRMHVNTG